MSRCGRGFQTLAAVVAPVVASALDTFHSPLAAPSTSTAAQQQRKKKTGLERRLDVAPQRSSVAAKQRRSATFRKRLHPSSRYELEEDEVDTALSAIL